MASGGFATVVMGILIDIIIEEIDYSKERNTLITWSKKVYQTALKSHERWAGSFIYESESHRRNNFGFALT